MDVVDLFALVRDKLETDLPCLDVPYGACRIDGDSRQNLWLAWVPIEGSEGPIEHLSLY